MAVSECIAVCGALQCLREEMRANLDHFLGRWNEATWEGAHEVPASAQP